MRRVTMKLGTEPRVEYLPNDGVEGTVTLGALVNTVGISAVIVQRDDGTVIEYQRVED